MTILPHRRGRDRGQVAIEYLGFLPILLLVGLAGLQLGIVAYAAQQAGTAARAAARAAALLEEDPDAGGPDGDAAAHAAADWVTGVHVGRESGGITATVTVRVPSVVPFWKFDDVPKTATMPLPDEEDLP
ncbi:TadE/TadG family type IV pilus assembly protein [Streptomyces sp. NPDC127166]|uniref:TadE/TadG family type IV pilus assembly protein n=1 Tax=Streptomyces sp. NPDC127166 TaxID=3345380 RepID=UPI00363BE208